MPTISTPDGLDSNALADVAGSDIAQESVGNSLLRTLASKDFAQIAPYLSRIALEPGFILARAGEAIDQVCFPEAGVIGFVDVLHSGQRLAVALAGREGFVGWPMLLGNDKWPHEAVVRAERGTALRIEARALASILDHNPEVRTALLRYASSLVAQMARTIVSNLIHPVESRTARWLLMYHDRVEGDEITITHEELSAMLGVRRSSITEAFHMLEGTGALKGHRGRVIVRDRARLEELAGETYGFAEGEYRRLLLPPRSV